MTRGHDDGAAFLDSASWPWCFTHALARDHAAQLDEVMKHATPLSGANASCLGEPGPGLRELHESRWVAMSATLSLFETVVTLTPAALVMAL